MSKAKRREWMANRPTHYYDGPKRRWAGDSDEAYQAASLLHHGEIVDRLKDYGSFAPELGAKWMCAERQTMEEPLMPVAEWVWREQARWVDEMHSWGKWDAALWPVERERVRFARRRNT